MPSRQPSLFDLPPGPPEGLRYEAGLLSPDEEGELARRFADLELKPFEFRGYLGNRRVVSYGWKYDFNDSALRETTEIPAFLLPLRERVAVFAGRAPEEFGHAMVTEYAPGAGIGWHRDRPEFGEVVGVSLLAPCVFRLRRKQATGWERASFIAEPRSAYLLGGAARTDWQHSIPPLDQLRYSVTFRTMRGSGSRPS